MLTLPFHTLATIATLAAFTAPKDDARQALTCISIEVKDGVLTALATDRHTVARYVVDLGGAGIDFPATLFPGKELSKVVVEIRKHRTAMVTLTPEGRFSYQGTDTIVPPTVNRAFPPIFRLFEKASPQPVGDAFTGDLLIRGEHLQRFSSLRDMGERRVEDRSLGFRLFVASDAPNAPLYAESRLTEEGGRFTVLVAGSRRH